MVKLVNFTLGIFCYNKNIKKGNMLLWRVVVIVRASAQKRKQRERWPFILEVIRGKTGTETRVEARWDK